MTNRVAVVRTILSAHFAGPGQAVAEAESGGG